MMLNRGHFHDKDNFTVFDEFVGADRDLRLGGSLQFVFYAGAQFRLHGLSPALCGL
jgi:hypothetical protein